MASGIIEMHDAFRWGAAKLLGSGDQPQPRIVLDAHMAIAAQINTPDHLLAAELPVLVIGGGPVGMRVAQLLKSDGVEVMVLSAEHHPPYNRVRLTPLLSGEVQFGEITLPQKTDNGEEIPLISGQRVLSIDRDNKKVTTSDGAVWPYSKLVIATGSSAFIPGIEGKDLSGV